MKKILTFTCVLLSLNVFSKSQDYKVGDKDFEAYVINKGENAPLVLLIHDWDGLDDYEIKRAKMLADLGYSVFALDMFGKGIRPAQIPERKKLTGALYKNRTRMKELMNGALTQAKKLGLNTKNAIALGYCFGGTSILEWAKSGVQLKGFASFHGNLKVDKGDSYKNTKAKIAAYHGSADKAVSMQDFAQLAAHLEEVKVDHEMMTYSGARHAFTKIGSDRYNEYADKKSWSHFKGFLKEQFK